jgi:hypothetical protein
LHLKLLTTSQLIDTDAFPLRYIEYKNLKIGYTSEDSLSSYVIKEKDTISKYSLEGVIDKIKTYKIN